MEKEITDPAVALRFAEAYYRFSTELTYSHVAQEFWLERSWLFLLIWASGINPLEDLNV